MVDALGGSHTRAVQVEVWDFVRREQVAALDVEDGTVSATLDAALTRRLDASVVAEEWLPLTPTNALSVYGPVVRASSGVELDGGAELAPLGVLRVTSLDARASAAGERLAVGAYDLGWNVQGASPAPVAISSGTPVEDAVRRLVRARDPRLVVELGYSGFECPSLYFEPSTDLWAEARRVMREGAGLELMFTVDGVCVARDVTGGPEVWHFHDGADGVCVEIGHTADAEEINNGVVVVSTHSGQVPVRGAAYDLDPDSPTYWHGPFGKRPVVIASEVVRTAGQARRAALGHFHALPPTQRVEITCVVNPLLDVGDTVRVTSDRLGLGGLWTIDELNVPLKGATMSLGARKLRQV